MGFWSFLLLVIFILAGVMLYHRLQTMEREIRAELQAKEAAAGSVTPPDDKDALPVEQVSLSREEEDSSLTEQERLLLEKIAGAPGVLQKDIYSFFPGQSKKQLQESLRSLALSGHLKREKSGGSYRLYAE